MTNYEKELRTCQPMYYPIARLHGRAKNWSGRYLQSWNNAVSYLRKEGWYIKVTPGPMGGTTTKSTVIQAIPPKLGKDARELILNRQKHPYWFEKH